MGDQYGPMVVAREKCSVTDLRDMHIAVPGTLTTAYLALRMCLATDFQFTEVPFDRIIEATTQGSYEGQPIDAGLIIHEGQLTYGDHDLQLILDTGQWWYEETGLPLPLGANAVRKDLGEEAILQVQRLLKSSIQYGLDHRQEALEYALRYGRDLDHAQADKFVGMYVNDWTLDFGLRGRQAVAELLKRGHEAGVIPNLIVPEFVDD
jgi:1,4-dihydroxy-6-naphthoate synthase